MIKDKLKIAATEAASWLPDALILAGTSGVAYGAWLVYAPAGFIVGGLFALAGGWLLAKGGK
jgi:hypothetical protein